MDGPALHDDPRIQARPAAALWRRVAARTADVVIVATVLWTLSALQVLAPAGRLADWASGGSRGTATFPILVGVVLGAVYEIVFVTRSSGQTPGKDLMNCRVVGTSTAVSPGRAFARWIPVAVIVALPPPWMVAAASAAVAAAALGWAPTDVIGRTRVIGYDRDVEDPSARRPSSRRARRAARGAQVDDPPPTKVVVHTSLPTGGVR